MRASTAPLIAITMGSDSAKTALEGGAAFLRRIGVPYESNIISAHRTPEALAKRSKEAINREIKVIIAAAGGSGHLPGMVAAYANLPVIAIPVRTNYLDGTDSLLSIVQMPKGCPVANVGINNSDNPAQLTIRILALIDAEIKQKLDAFLQDQTDQVLAKAERMQQLGIEGYTWP